MKKCPNCSFENNLESLFCQECGFKLPEIKKKKVIKHHIESDEDHKFVWTCDFCGEEFPNKKTCDFHEKECDKRPILTNKNGIYQKLKENEINDVVFEPKNKKHIGSVVAIIVSIIVIFFVIIALSNSTSSTDTFNTNTNTKNQSNNYFSPTELSYLKLDGGNMRANSYGSVYPTYEVTLYNSGPIPAKRIVAKINFFKADDTSTNAMPQDTQYVILADFLGSGDSTHINSYIETAFNTSGRFRWYAEIFSAEKY